MARFIYIDEAGTSVGEPVAVVAGVIVHPDNQWQTAWDYLEELKKDVPEDIRKDYIFHATELFSGGKRWNRQRWDKSVRWPILEKLLAGPRLCRITVVVAWSLAEPLKDGEDPKRAAFYRHAVAFLECLKAANSAMRTHYPGEKATLTAEDDPKMRQWLKQLPGMLRASQAPEFFTGPYPFDAIVDAPHFTGKEGAPLLQMADAIAFAVRHYLSGHPEGRWAMGCVLGKHDNPTRIFSETLSPAGARVLAWSPPSINFQMRLPPR